MFQIAFISLLLGFNPPTDQIDLPGGGRLVLSIGEVPEVAERGKPLAVAVEISSAASKEVAGKLRIDLEPSWSIQGPAERSLAGKKLLSVEFAGGDIHRQHVTWEGGIEVYVNRGKEDWPVDGQVLQRFGFLAKKGNDLIACRAKDRTFARAPDANYIEIPGFGFRTETAGKSHLDLMVLPGSNVPLKLSTSSARPREVRALKIEGSRRLEAEKIEFEWKDNQVSFSTQPGAAGYRIMLER